LRAGCVVRDVSVARSMWGALEHPVVVLLGAAVAAMLLGGVYRAGQASWARLGMWVTILVGGLLAAAGFAIRTPREALIETCREMAFRVERGDLPGLRSFLAHDLDAEGRDREAFLAASERTLRTYHIEEPRLSGFNIELTDAHAATATFNAVCRVVTRSQVLDRLPTRWVLRFRREGETWVVTRIELVPSPTSPASNLREALP